MGAQSEAEIQFNVDGRLIVARPRPEDKDALAQLLGSGQNIKVKAASGDTEGHVLASSDIAVDVEGHAMILRLPNSGDAETIRRALGVAALTATVAVAGFTAGTWQTHTTVPAQPPAIVVPAVPFSHAAPITENFDEGAADTNAQSAAEQYAAQNPQTVAAPIQAPTGPQSASGPIVVGDDVVVGGAPNTGVQQSESTSVAPAQAPEAPQPAPRPFNPQGERPE
jgi:hypothetical protein